MKMIEAKEAAIAAIEKLCEAQEGPMAKRRAARQAAGEILMTIPVNLKGKLPDALVEALTNLA